MFKVFLLSKLVSTELVLVYMGSVLKEKLNEQVYMAIPANVQINIGHN